MIVGKRGRWMAVITAVVIAGCVLFLSSSGVEAVTPAEKQEILDNADITSKDYYKVLGVSWRAKEARIKLAYRILSMKWHPDRNQDDPKAHERFLNIRNAYDVLINKRRSYDLNWLTFGLFPVEGEDEEVHEKPEPEERDDESDEEKDDDSMEMSELEMLMVAVMLASFGYFGTLMCCCRWKALFISFAYLMELILLTGFFFAVAHERNRAAAALATAPLVLLHIGVKLCCRCFHRKKKEKQP